MKNLIIPFYQKITFKYLFDFEKEDPDVKEWKEYLETLPDASNNYIMSYNKYLCRMWYFPFKYKLFINAISILILSYYFINILKNSRKKINKHSVENVLIKSINVGYKDIYPKELLKEFGEPHAIDSPGANQYVLNKVSFKIFFKTCLKKPFRFHYLAITLKELCIYSSILKQYNSKAITCYVNERNVASPLITQMLEQNKMEYIHFMHGEYLLQLIQGYMKFSRFYVWDEHYEKMFVNDLNCPKDQMIVYTPGKLSKIFKIENEPYLCTYYFGAESIQRIKKISEVFEGFRKKGFKCKVRPHPRRSNYDAINQYFKNFHIENPSEVTIDESIELSKYIIGLNSTVLSEALHGGKRVVLDDISEPERYKSLSDRNYILTKKDNVLLLSNLIESGV